MRFVWVVIPRFVYREEELTFLQNRYKSGDAELLIVYRRRRTGKSELARRSIRNRDDAIYGQQNRLQLLGDDAYNRLIEPELADHASQSFPTRGVALVLSASGSWV